MLQSGVLFGWNELNSVFIFSMSEIQNARGIMDVLAEMLNALDPGNREVPNSISMSFNSTCTIV
jgi:hypothetical protein